MNVKPDIQSIKSKKDQVEQMFNNIADKYDFLNHLLSFGIDKLWRKKVRKAIFNNTDTTLSNFKLLDIATGTGDLAIEISKIPNIQIEGIDISNDMLMQAKKKICKKNLSKRINFKHGDAEKIPFNDNEFNAVTVAFGVRNFDDLNKGLKEIYRILKKNGLFIVLEFSKPKRFPFKQIFWIYFNSFLPIIGKLVSKNKYAYSYLPNSVKHFAERHDLVEKLKNAGFSDIKFSSLTFGVASIYFSYKMI